MYFVRRGGEYLDASGLSFRDFMAGELPILPGELPAIDDFEDHLSTIFPEVRLKRFLEMRGSDSGPWSLLCAFSAFWTGILYDDAALDAAWELVKDWTEGEREALRQSVRTLGLKAPIPGRRTLQDLAKDVLDISRSGLRARAKYSVAGDDETGFLQDLDRIVVSGQTPAESLLEKYNGPWKQDLSKIFQDQAY
jgi:glutamate--cysteine ligase